MMVTCWNCGTEMEKKGAEEYKASLLSFLHSMEELFDRTDNPDVANIYKDVIYVIENF